MVLALREVSFGYPVGPPVLSRASLTVRAGEIVVVLGPNGAGKTTLIGVAAGRLGPTRGGVARADSCAGAWRPGGRLAPLDDDGHGAALVRAGESGAEAAWRLLDLADPPASLVLLDDPAADLDARGQERLCAGIVRAREAGAGVLLATKDIAWGHRVGDIVAVLDSGGLRVCEPDDVLLDIATLGRLGLRERRTPPIERRRARPHPVGTHRLHAARLARVVRDCVGAERTARVRLEQTLGDAVDGQPVTVISLDQPDGATWVFGIPLHELSPHRLRLALAEHPRGHTHAVTP